MLEPSTARQINGSVEAATFIKVTRKDKGSGTKSPKGLLIRKIGEPAPKIRTYRF